MKEKNFLYKLIFSLSFFLLLIVGLMITLPETAFIEKNIKFFIICFLLFVEGYCLGKMAEIIAETTVKIIKINKEHKN